jgi:hypothetical protein
LENSFAELAIKIEDIGRSKSASPGADLGKLEGKAISYISESGCHKYASPSSFVAGLVDVLIALNLGSSRS